MADNGADATKGCGGGNKSADHPDLPLLVTDWLSYQSSQLASSNEVNVRNTSTKLQRAANIAKEAFQSIGAFKSNSYGQDLTNFQGHFSQQLSSNSTHFLDHLVNHASSPQVAREGRATHKLRVRKCKQKRELEGTFQDEIALLKKQNTSERALVTLRRRIECEADSHNTGLSKNGEGRRMGGFVTQSLSLSKNNIVQNAILSRQYLCVRSTYSDNSHLVAFKSQLPYSFKSKGELERTFLDDKVILEKKNAGEQHALSTVHAGDGCEAESHITIPFSEEGIAFSVSKNNIVQDAILSRQYQFGRHNVYSDKTQLVVLKTRLNSYSFKSHDIFPIYCLTFDKTGQCEFPLNSL